MKYFILSSITLFCFACEHVETPEERYKRIEDSTLAVADSIAKAALAKEKKTQDSIAEARARVKRMCPELVPFFEMSDRFVATMKNGELGDSLTKNFGLISDSIIVLEKKIMDKEFSKMDTACQHMFLRRMSQKTFDMTDELMKKLK
jgi:hypothetical protein